MFGYGFNLPTLTTVVFGGALAYALGHNITNGKVLAHNLGADWKVKWAEMKAKYKAWKVSK